MIQRSITGLLLGLFMIGSILYSEWTACLLFLIIAIGSSYEWYIHFTKSAGNVPSLIFFAFSCICVISLVAIPSNLLHTASMVPYERLLLPCLLLLMMYAFTAVLLYKDWVFSLSWHCGIFYIHVPVLIAMGFLHNHFELHRWLILGLVMINWSNDVFAYFGGRIFGKHFLSPKISPKKTIEGALCGLAAAVTLSYFLPSILPVEPLSLVKTLILGGSVWGSGTLGDLYESRLKRIAGIKDSGQILPGHGGFLDRFDSFFYVLVVGIFVLNF